MADRFDLTAPTTPVMTGVVLDQTRVHQQAAYDPVGERAYVTQVIANGVTLPGESGPPPTGTRDSRGDLAINQVDLDGNLTGVMWVRAFDHGSGISVENDAGTPYIWIAYDAEMEPIGTNAHGRRIARLPFQPGAVIDIDDASIEDYNPIPNATSITPCLDLANDRFAIAYNNGGGTRYRVYRLADWRAKAFDAPLYEFPRPSFPQFQGWTLFGDFVYQFHGTGYNATNPPGEGGNAWFTTIDIRTGAVVDRTHDQHVLELDYREPEAIGVWQRAGGPELVFGYASGPSGGRLLNLYAISALVPQETDLVAQVVEVPEPGVKLTVTVSDPASVRSWTIYRTVGGRDQILFSGTGPTLPAESTWLDDAPPACVPIEYRLVVERSDGTLDGAAASVTYVPEGGCGAAGPVGEQDTVLGCAATYTAVVHWRGGARPYVALDALTAVSWSRTVNDISEASVTVSIGDLSPECVEQLTGSFDPRTGAVEGGVHPWVHELTIYRDEDLVWQGPVVRPVARRNAGTITIEAADVFAWFDHLVNTFQVRYVDATADPQGRMRAPITYIAENHIRLNLVESPLSVPPDYPNLMDYVVRRDDGLPTIKVEKDGSSNTAVWTAYLGDILREWTKRGLTWTTVGRSLLLRGAPNSNTRATARLTLDHFAGNIEVIRNGVQAATYAFATSQETRDLDGGATVGTGQTGTPYGRLDILVRVQEEGATDTDLREAARSVLAGRYPAPTVINVPDNARLTVDAPITMRQLVPGERIDLLADMPPLAQGFVLSDVDVSWGQGGEQVGIALIPLADVEEA